MKKTLLVCSGLVIFIPLTSIAVDITHKVGAIFRVSLTVQNIQNLSFGLITINSNPDSEEISVDTNGTSSSSASVSKGHPGIIKITGNGYISIQSTPPTALIHTTDSTKTVGLNNMKIVHSDGSAISNINNIEITNGELELKTIGKISIGNQFRWTTPGEYTADWPITIVYVDNYEPE